MTTDLKHFYAGVAIIALALFGGLFVHAWWMGNHQPIVQMQAAAATAAPVIKAADTSIATSQAQAKTDQTALTVALAAYNKPAATAPIQPVDYDKLSAMVAQKLNSAPATVTTKTDPATGKAATTVDTLDLTNGINKCEAAIDGLTLCQKLQADKDKTIAAQDDKIQAQQTEITTDQTIIKGGLFKKRVKTALQHTLCGAAGAGAGFGVSKSNGTGDSAAAGGAAYAACEGLFAIHHLGK